MKEDVFNQYVERVLSLFNIKKEEFFSQSKKRDLVDARHLVYYLCSERPIHMTYIVNFMKKNGHNVFRTSITHGVKSVSKKVEQDRDYESIVKMLN